MKRAILLLLLATGSPPAPMSVHGPRSTVHVGAPDFTLDVLPILTRSGCNAGGCHGGAKGQNGFKLSLLGYDADADYEAIAMDLHSRRINRAAPDDSLLIQKSTMRIKHTGGKALREGADTVLAWIKAGAPRKTRDSNLLSVDVTPAAIVKRDGDTPLKVTARYSDDTTRDVTTMALYSTNDDSIATVTPDGVVRTLRNGETTIIVRYGGFVVPVTAGYPFAMAQASTFKPANLVDEQLAAKWKSLGIIPSFSADDATFLRRAFLDVIGTLPTPDEVRAFLAKPDRVKLIDDLLKRPEFDLFWTLKLSQWLMVGAQKFSPDYPAWLKSRIDEPITETAKLLVTAKGTSAPASFFSVDSDPRVMMEFTVQTFHGFRMQCANCHNHPLERFAQDDYHSLAAVYSRVRHERGLVLSPRGELTNPRTGRVAAPRFDGDDRRVPFAEWLVSDPRFARAWANRLFGEIFGRGLVHAVDDMRASNPPSVPALLDALAAEFAKTPKLRPFLRLLLTSSAYGLSSKGQVDDKFFSHAIVKPLPAEVVLDAITMSQGALTDRAISRVDPSQSTPLLDALGRCSRTRICAEFQGSLRQALALATLEVKAPSKEVEELFLRTLSRPPTAKERDYAATCDPDELMWALIATKEFQMRH